MVSERKGGLMMMKKVIQNILHMNNKRCIGIYGLYFTVLLFLFIGNEIDAMVILFPLIALIVIKLLLNKDVIAFIYTLLIATILLLAFEIGL
jgi:membrane-associated HD superfamily phosphohydrolase